MWIGVISLFPEMFQALGYGITDRALKNNLLQLKTWNPRSFTQDKHQRVDDRPYGGGPGMVMMYQPVKDALLAAKKQAPDNAKTILLSPQGKLLTHQRVIKLAKEPGLILLSGRYEGIDERIQHHIDDEYSIGDYVLSGGELPAMVLIDSIVRQLPGALGHELSAEQDSHVDGLLDCPHYTRPEVIDGYAVPDVLLSGNHQKIEKWRRQQALKKTSKVRPDLLSSQSLDSEAQNLLDAIKKEPE